MRVRIVKRDPDWWTVETREWWQLRWNWKAIRRQEQEALRIAELLKHPIIVEIV